MSNFYLFLIYAVCISAKPPSNIRQTTTASPLDKFLSKFHQSDYTLTFERSELVRYDTNLITTEVRTFKYNRTAPVVNASFIITVDMGYDLEVIAQAYRFASNEYREFPIHCQVNVCQAIQENTLGTKQVVTSGNLVCPFMKGKKYYFYNFAPEEANFPPFIPTGQYMVEFQYLFHSKELFVLNNYLIISRPIFIP